jgi:anti-sigma regulatory factor (Ser/Thr protein kinase)
MPEFPDSTIQFTISSTPAHLPVVRAALDRLCELLGMNEEWRGGTVLAVDEALTNIIRHAYHGAAGNPIELRLSRVSSGDEGDRLAIRIRDWGECVDLDRIKSRDLADVRPGGLGVHIMTNCMDTVTYAHAEGGGTVLTMTRLLSGEEE